MSEQNRLEIIIKFSILPIQYISKYSIMSGIQDSCERPVRLDSVTLTAPHNTPVTQNQPRGGGCQLGLLWSGSTIVSQLGHSAQTPGSPSVVSYSIMTHVSWISWSHCGHLPKTGLLLVIRLFGVYSHSYLSLRPVVS